MSFLKVQIEGETLYSSDGLFSDYVFKEPSNYSSLDQDGNYTGPFIERKIKTVDVDLEEMLCYHPAIRNEVYALKQTIKATPSEYCIYAIERIRREMELGR